MRRLLVLVAATLAAVVAIPPTPVSALTGPGPNQAVRTRSYPDPFVLRVDGTFYAYATDGDLGEVQLIRSTNLVDWSPVGSALGAAPSWAQADDVWAPSVARISASSYVLYASFVRSSTGKRCIGTATASSPEGPFQGTATPIVCDDARNGVIDPEVFVSGSSRHLLWKTEGVPGTEPPAVYSQPLAADGLGLTGSPAPIFESRQPWEGTLIENPSMVTEGGRTYLFYSGNEWESDRYGIGWALCGGPQGPCVAPPNRPLLTSEPGILGPGGGSAFRDDEGLWMAFAAWTDPARVTEDGGGQRALFLRRLTFTGGRPLLAGKEPPFTTRWAGNDRYETAAAFSAMTVQSARPITYVATGATFHDALIAAPAAGVERSPVLLVERDRIAPSVRAELARVHPGHIVVMGGPDVISDAVYAELRAMVSSDDAIHREVGINVYHRSALVSRNTHAPGVGVAFVATGAAFPDALAGGAAGAHRAGP
ncbi:MAG TPA: family 43 glycosylhydrolase, partial [Acidimicrobiales bacterium]|nr:family 43 glycosylhydrolase [Acidimicrobiales bacterium]